MGAGMDRGVEKEMGMKTVHLEIFIDYCGLAADRSLDGVILDLFNYL